MPNLAGFHIANELRRFKRAKLTRLAMASLVLIPLLYSALYLWAFWNPLNNTAALPVALVNSDRGASLDGEVINAGDQVVEGLHDNDQITWSEVSAQEAEQGVKDGRYYFSVELPEDFSAAVTSAGGHNAEKARLIAHYNDANGYLSTIIGENVMREVINAVGTKISAQAVDKVLIGVLDAGSGLNQAAAGAGLLADGTGQLVDGTGQLVDQVPELKDGTARLADGLVQLKDGTSQLSDGTQQLVDKISPLKKIAADLDVLEDPVQQLGDSSLVVNDAASKVSSKVGEAAKVQGASADSLREMAAQLRALNLPAVTGVAAQLEANAQALDAAGLGPNSALTADLNRLTDGAREISTQLSDPKAKVRSSLDQVIGSQSAIHQLIDGAGQINDGAHLIDENMTTARDGAKLIADGTVRLDDGANQLNDGANQINDGMNELHDRLADGVKRVPTWNEGQRIQSANTIGGPVTVQAQAESKPSSFGTGLSPFFVALSLFIGGIVVFQLFKPLQQRAIAAGVGSLRATFDGYLPVFLLAAVQAAIVVGVSVGVVGLRPENLVGFTLFAILVAAVFMAINQALIALLGAGPGRVTSLGVLMVMAVASGGIYPVETQNSLIEFFHPFNPMTYAVDGLRQTLYGFHDERLWIAIGVMVATLLVSLGVTTIAARMQRNWTMNRLHPVLPT